jgi:predicted DNA-binding antitoxin AbrB/MazE fold protein
MTITIDAVFENGTFKPTQPVALAEGTPVRLTIDTADEDADPLDAVIGVCTEGPDISLAERHDAILYGLNRMPPERP